MADKRLEDAKNKETKIRAALVNTDGKGVNINGRGAMTKTPNELGKEKDMEQ